MAWIPEGYSGWLFGGFSVSTVLWGFLMVYSFNTALHYRPLPDHTGIGRARTSTRLRELRTDMVPVGLHVARWMVQVATVAFSKYMIGWRNKIEVVDDANSKFLYSAMRTRPQGVPLLTVANHASSMDDPGLLSCMMPLDVILRPSKVRWSIATQEIVFPDIPWIQVPHTHTIPHGGRRRSHHRTPSTFSRSTARPAPQTQFHREPSSFDRG